MEIEDAALLLIQRLREAKPTVRVGLSLSKATFQLIAEIIKSLGDVPAADFYCTFAGRNCGQEGMSHAESNAVAPSLWSITRPLP